MKNQEDLVEIVAGSSRWFTGVKGMKAEGMKDESILPHPRSSFSAFLLLPPASSYFLPGCGVARASESWELEATVQFGLISASTFFIAGFCPGPKVRRQSAIKNLKIKISLRE
jgi:hypothetical protein